MDPAGLHRARRNVLIPNQEWFEPTDLKFLRFLENRGFHIQQLESAYLPHTPGTLGYNYWGRCVPAGCLSLPLTATAAPATPGGESNPESGTP